MITLAHLSDIHLAPLPPVRPLDVVNKRITGYLNWRLRRAPISPAAAAFRRSSPISVSNRRPDFTCITGDLVNLGLDAEIATALGWLKGIGPAERGLRLSGQPRRLPPGYAEPRLRRLARLCLG